MNIIFSNHSEYEIIRRRLDKRIVITVINRPDQKFIIGDKIIFQSKYFDKTHGKEMLIRIIVIEAFKDLKVITLYKTSKISKYWKV